MSFSSLLPRLATGAMVGAGIGAFDSGDMGGVLGGAAFGAVGGAAFNYFGGKKKLGTRGLNWMGRKTRDLTPRARGSSLRNKTASMVEGMKDDVFGKSRSAFAGAGDLSRKKYLDQLADLSGDDLISFRKEQVQNVMRPKSPIDPGLHKKLRSNIDASRKSGLASVYRDTNKLVSNKGLNNWAAKHGDRVFSGLAIGSAGLIGSSMLGSNRGF